MRLPLVIGLFVPLAVAGQQRSISAQLDPDTIPLGGRAVLTLVVDPGGMPLQWPALGDTLTANIEVLQDGGVDTLVVEDDVNVKLVRKLEITCFDSGGWVLPPQRIDLGGSIMQSEALVLHVNGVPIKEGEGPKDIKPIIELPFSIVWWARQHWQWLASGTGLVIAAIAVILFIRRRRARIAAPAPPAPEIPLHERVLLQLQELERQRLWQQGDHKAYQSRLTDLLRGYIEVRYQVPALERTTDELLHELRVSPLMVDQQQLLANMLRLADMVKFAKALPSPQENEQMMASAQRFVRETAAANTTIHARN